MKTAPEQLQDLVDAGATITITNAAARMDPITIPLAVCEILAEGRLFYCPPTPYDQHDLHEFAFSTVEQPHELGIMFYGPGERNRAYVTTIEETVMDDTDAVQLREQFAAWKLLQASGTEQANRYKDFISSEIKSRRTIYINQSLRRQGATRYNE